MSPILRSNDYSLDFTDLYGRMWDLATDDNGNGTRLYQPDDEHALKWLIVELAGTPAIPGKTTTDNNAIRKQVHAALADGWAHRLSDRTSFRLLKPPPARTGEWGRLHDLMSAIPRGCWTTYGELGELVGMHPRGLGSHIPSCSVCPNVVRVLNTHGDKHGSGFRWSDPTRTDDPNDVLRDEGITFTGERASLVQFIGAADLAALLLERNKVAQFDWPTVEWVKAPIVLQTDEPSGAGPHMRHFRDCSHWFRTGEGALRGAAPEVADDNQMRNLRACGHCTAREARAGNVERGPRLAGLSDAFERELDDFDDDQDDALFPASLSSTDATALTAVRREQAYLRRHLLRKRPEAPCDLCGRTLPARMLVAAHITPRRYLSEPERLNFAAAAMLACILGCDALFEHRYIAVDDQAHIIELRAPGNDALQEAVTHLVGKTVVAFTPATASGFRKHRTSPLRAHEPSAAERT